MSRAVRVAHPWSPAAATTTAAEPDSAKNSPASRCIYSRRTPVTDANAVEIMRQCCRCHAAALDLNWEVN